MHIKNGHVFDEHKGVIQKELYLDGGAAPGRRN